LTNKIPDGQYLQISLSDFNLKWGHFYDCNDEKRSKISSPKQINLVSGETIQICSTGAKMIPVGVEGVATLTIREEYDHSHPALKAVLFWDSPVMKSKNKFNITYIEGLNNDNLKLTCREDFNKRGGALGNVECLLESTLKEIPKVAEPPVIVEFIPDVKAIIVVAEEELSLVEKELEVQEPVITEEASEAKAQG